MAGCVWVHTGTGTLAPRMGPVCHSAVLMAPAQDSPEASDAGDQASQDLQKWTPPSIWSNFSLTSGAPHHAQVVFGNWAPGSCSFRLSKCKREAKAALEVRSFRDIMPVLSILRPCAPSENQPHQLLQRLQQRFLIAGGPSMERPVQWTRAACP